MDMELDNDQLAAALRRQLMEIVHTAIKSKRHWSENLLSKQPEVVVQDVKRHLDSKLEALIIGSFGMRRRGSNEYEIDVFAKGSNIVLEVVQKHLGAWLEDAIQDMKENGKWEQLRTTAQQAFLTSLKYQLEQAARTAGESAAKSVQLKFQTSIQNLMTTEMNAIFDASDGLAELARSK